jgi:AcrR family transcriptional regulator
MDEVATRAGLSRSTMYFYFASKEDLLAGLLARTHDEIVGPAAILLNAGTAPDRAVRQVLEALLRTCRQHGPALRTFLETGLVSPTFGPRWRPTTNEIIDVTAQFIDRERAAGRLPAGPPSAPPGRNCGDGRALQRAKVGFRIRPERNSKRADSGSCSAPNRRGDAGDPAEDPRHAPSHHLDRAIRAVHRGPRAGSGR